MNCCDTKNKQANKGTLDPFVIGIIAVTVIILFGAIFLAGKTGGTVSVPVDTQVSLTTSDTKYDWGDIDINGGMAIKDFEIKNNGSSVLKLYDVKTSCTCTTAQLKSASLTSPKFSMHDKGPFVFEINPGKSASLIVEFDPLFHGPNGTGPISRTITMSSNDANNPTLSYILTANVVKK
ncbi:hypothetical protein AUJ42_02500 [Candidatus Collierbacteria bacterium CG1_02_44_10]|uniref:DUF1573 domain-containing protein n=1 Tax=Candidatus Collierbacteria bacterium CG1_02_44_10 TaxID=1805087 RepID=A0A1J4RX13_9BACT|nr:MAG: hypothetical protein AUJ42_02500 [Candidatus Collierbacteria bacterium CG1_02_44_10]